MSTLNNDPVTTPSDNDSRAPVSIPSRRFGRAANLIIYLERRAAESSATFRQNVHNVVDELRPIINAGRHPDPGSTQTLSLSTYVNLRLPTWINLNTDNALSSPSPSSSTETEDRNPVVIGEVTPVTQIMLPFNTQRSLTRPPFNDVSIDIDLSNSDLSVEHFPSSPGVSLPNVSNTNNNNNNNNTENHNEEDVLQRNIDIETTQMLSVAIKYFPFLMILLSKTVFDHIPAIFLFLVHFISFYYFNNAVKRQVAKQSQRSIGFLLLTLIHIGISVFLLYYFYWKMHLHFEFIFISPYIQPSTIKNTLWSISIYDYILKLITIIFKILVIMMPIRYLTINKRGKVYLFIEATSQLYRCCNPIQPWLYYMLLESFQGSKKIIGFFLSAAYIVFKWTDLTGYVKLWLRASNKLLQDVALGTAPSKEQLTLAGSYCPICHEEYATPVLLQCHHIFCEGCVAKWFDHEQTCPLCRAKLVDDPVWRDGSTTHFIQLF